jgi:HEPN superfamily AbiU2-like protein
MLRSLKAEVIFGRTHLRIAKLLRAADPVVIHTGRTFFGLTLDAHLDIAQMYAAKLHDKARRTISVESALDEAECIAGKFSHASPEQVRLMVKTARLELKQLEETLSTLEDRRNEYLAHLVPNTVVDPSEINTRATLTIDDLDHLLLETGNVLNDLSQFYDGSFSALEMLDSDDCKHVFHLLAEAKCAEAEKFEREHGEPWPFERPAICRERASTQEANSEESKN